MTKWIPCIFLLLLLTFAACGKGGEVPTEAAIAEVTEATTGGGSAPTMPETTAASTSAILAGLTLEADDMGSYYGGSIHDLVLWAAQDSADRARVLACSESYILLDVSLDASSHFRYAVFCGDTILLDEQKRGTPPSFSFVTESILRMTKGFGINAMSTQYFDLSAGKSSRDIGHSGTLADYYDATSGTMLAAYYALGARRPALLIEDVFTGNVMEVQRYYENIISPIHVLHFEDISHLYMEYTDFEGNASSETIAIDLTSPSGLEDGAGQEEHYRIKTRWQIGGSNPYAAHTRSSQIIGFAIGFEYDTETKTYLVADDMGGYQVEDWEITNHSITIAVSNAFDLPVDRYPGPSVMINERVIGFHEGTRYIFRTYYYGHHHEYETTDSQNLITVYFDRDFEIGEIRDLHFVWGKLD